jgi:hypothetical protein
MSVEPHESLRLSFAKKGNAAARGVSCTVRHAATGGTRSLGRSLQRQRDVVPDKLFPQPTRFLIPSERGQAAEMRRAEKVFERAGNCSRDWCILFE